MGIVERLRSISSIYTSETGDWCGEAADKIEFLMKTHDDMADEIEILREERNRLREALEKAQCGCEAPCLHGQYCSSWIAQIALKEKE